MLDSKTHYILIMCVSVVLTACYEPIEGCLDPLSNNYALTADNNCGECCTYPTLGLRLTHRWGEDLLATDSIYFNAQRESFRILSAEFLIHDLSVRQESNRVSTTDSLSIDCDTSLQFISDSYKAYSLSQSIATLPNFKSAGVYDEVSFTLGISECLQKLALSSIDDESISYATLEKNNAPDSAFMTIRFSLIPAAASDTVDIIINNSALTVINLEDDLSNEKGDNLIASIVVDYATWLQDIDFDMTTEELKQGITDNTERSFSVLK